MRRPRLRTLAIGAAVGLVAVGGTGAGLELGHRQSGGTLTTRSAGATVAVARGRLAQAQELTGALGFGQPTTVTGHGEGTITWLPATETTVTRGHQVYRVDDRPVVLLYGALPLYRTLTSHPGAPGGGDSGDGADSGDSGDAAGSGTDQPPPVTPLLRGSDVDLVAANLAALGLYHGPTSEVTYSWPLTYAVERWQRALGEQPSGVIDPREVVVARGPIRVDGVTAHLGDDAQQPVLTVTSTAKKVTLQAPVALAGSIKVGHRVRVRLPDGRTVGARVESIGTAAGDGDGGPPSVPVVVRPVRAGALRRVALGPVTARVVTASVPDALHVPIAALVALAGGGYAVERSGGGLVRVTIGMVADGEVQVFGVSAGTRVVIAR
ncbi:hypothetical protein P5P86_05310 [Nocardioides sp. BP30]|uniref:hypothetical protein n=1 Tax=Nocardioides sp. BP30 TaxID=3036374 RepID=UPI0024691FA5|nr:hypothetical protein [Nocardioides sp. BP30]WGL53243.1 hypothetical protein P5P86_05310 [Nocardioides sp. BP30]